MTNLVHQPIEERTLERWVENFQEEIAGTVRAVENVQASHQQLEKYVLYIEDTFSNKLAKHLSASVFKTEEVNTVGVHVRTLYTSAGPLTIKPTVDPLVGYANDRPWYFAVKRDKFQHQSSSSMDILYNLVREELQLYLEAFPNTVDPSTTLPVYTSIKQAEGRDTEYHFGKIMPPELQGKDVRCEFEYVDLGITWFIPCYANQKRRAVNPAARLVHREGEW